MDAFWPTPRYTNSSPPTAPGPPCTRSTSEEALEAARNRIRSQNWISALEETPGPGGEKTWLVKTTDEAAAEENLLRLALEEKSIKILGFGRKRQSLEEAFFDLIEGGGDET
jgi:hypothetical protein